MRRGKAYVYSDDDFLPGEVRLLADMSRGMIDQAGEFLMVENCRVHVLLRHLMKWTITLPTAAALLLCTPSFAQNPTPEVTQPVKPLTKTAREGPKDWEKEQRSRMLIQEQMRRDHSDPSGRVRPDLWSEGVAHMKRMKVVHQIGPAPKESPEKK